MQEVIKLFKQIQNTSSTNDKKAIIVANKDNESLYYGVEGEGYQSFIKYVRSGVREANALTGISLSLGSSSINYNSTTTATVTATYTSGSSKDVTSSLSTSSSATSNYIKSGDTSIVTIS